MRIGAALEALEFVTKGMATLDRRSRLDAYGTAQVLIDRLRTIVRTRGMSLSLINAQLLKLQLSVEALAGLGSHTMPEEQVLNTIEGAFAALAGADCFGYHLDTVE